jgi:hypothetical protein
MPESVQFGSNGYMLMLALLFFGRGMDFLSTYVATPNLQLEGNPIAKKLGWRWGVLLNVIMCFTFALWPLTAIIITTTGLLVAARNFKSAWLMRSMGEEPYRAWYCERISRTRMRLIVLALLGETILTAFVGTALVLFSRENSVAFAIGLGVIAYAVVVLFYTSLSLYRLRHHRQYLTPEPQPNAEEEEVTSPTEPRA